MEGHRMNMERLNERSADFIKASQRLTEACAQPVDSFIRDSVIRRFEFCWELELGLYMMATLGVRHSECVTFRVTPMMRNWPTKYMIL